MTRARVLVVAGVAVLGLLLLPTLLALFTEAVAPGWAADRLAFLTGWNRSILFGVMMILCLPLTWAISTMVTIRPGKLGPFPKRQLAEYLIILYVGLWSITQGVALLTGPGFLTDASGQLIATECCGTLPDGTRIRRKGIEPGRCGFDPEYGIPLELCTAENAIADYLRDSDWSPQEIQVDSIAAFNRLEPFDSIDQSPLLFFAERSGGELAAFRGAGFDPRTSDPLAPATAELLSRFEAQVRAAESEMAAASMEADRIEAARRTAAEIAAVYPSSDSLLVASLAGGEQAPGLTAALASALGATPVSAGFWNAGEFERLEAGQGRELPQEFASTRVLLVRRRAEVRDDTAGTEFVEAIVELRAVVVAVYGAETSRPVAVSGRSVTRGSERALAEAEARAIRNLVSALPSVR